MSHSSQTYTTRYGRESKQPAKFGDRQPTAVMATAAGQEGGDSATSVETTQDDEIRVVYPANGDIDGDPNLGGDVNARRQREEEWKQQVRNAVDVYDGEYDIDVSELLDSEHTIADVLAVVANMSSPRSEAAPLNGESEGASSSTESDNDTPEPNRPSPAEDPATRESTDGLFVSPPSAPATEVPAEPFWLTRMREEHRQAKDREASMVSSIVGHSGPEPSINVGGQGTAKKKFKLFGVDLNGSPSYRQAGVAPPPRVLVPGTPDSQEDGTSHATQSTTRVTESATRLAENTAANRGHRPNLPRRTVVGVAPARASKKSKALAREPSTENEYDDPLINAQIAQLETQTDKQQSDSEASMTGRIPAAEKGKGKAVTFEETESDSDSSVLSPRRNEPDPRDGQIAKDEEIARALQKALKPQLVIDTKGAQDSGSKRKDTQTERQRELGEQIRKEEAERSTLAFEIQRLKIQLALLEAEEKAKASEVKRKRIVRALEDSFKDEPEEPVISTVVKTTMPPQPIKLAAQLPKTSEGRRQRIIKALQESYDAENTGPTHESKKDAEEKAQKRTDSERESGPPKRPRRDKQAQAPDPNAEQAASLAEQLNKYVQHLRSREGRKTAGRTAQRASAELHTPAEQRSSTAETLGKTASTLKETPLTLKGEGDEDGDPSSSSSSSSSTSDSESDESVSSSSETDGSSKKKTRKKSAKAKEARQEKKEKKRRKRDQRRLRKQRKAGQKALRYNKPSTYYGDPSYDKFESWIEEVEEWQEANDLSEYAVVTATVRLLSKSAKDWYKANVSKKETEWTFKRLTDELFDDSFPTNYASVMRRTFETATQGNFPVKKWYRYLNRLAKRVTLLTPYEVTRAFWKGSAEYLKENWAMEGWDPEDPLLAMDTLYNAALRYERAKEWRNAERGHAPKQGRAKPNQQPAQSSNDRNNPPRGPERGSKGDQNKTQGPRNNATGQGAGGRTDNNSNNNRSSGGREPKRKFLSEEKKAALRAEGRCFGCEKQGHDQRNCPDRRELKPSKNDGGKRAIYGGALRPEGVRTKRGEPVIRLNMIEPLTSDGVVASAIRKRKEEERTLWQNFVEERKKLTKAITRGHLAKQLLTVEPVMEWQRYSPNRKFRFEIEDGPEGVFYVRDVWQSWEAVLMQEELEKPDFNVKKWAKDMNNYAPRTLHRYQEDIIQMVTESPTEYDADIDSECTNELLSDESSSEAETAYLGEDSGMEESDDEVEPPGNTLVTSMEQTDLEGPSVAPAVPETGHGNWKLPSIGCSMAKLVGNQPRPKGRPTKGEKVWGNLEDNSAKIRDEKRVMPHPIILTVHINGRPARALLDCGAFSDFISTTLVDILGLKRTNLKDPLTLQMAVQGSKSKINAQSTVQFSYSTINCQKTVDVINIANYDVILGTSFYYQHKILAGMNPTRIAIGSNEPLPIAGDDVHTIMGANAMRIEDELQAVRDMLAAEAAELCEDTTTSALPPFRAINHHIPLIDENKVYKYRPSKCPRALETQWREKANEYLSTGRWQMATGSNPIPILLIQKPRKSPDDPVRLRACFDKREQNANTRKLASPLPDQTEVLERIAAHKYRSVLDGKDAYEQIRVAEEDVWKTLFNSPSGTMISLVLQQGDCNGPPTYQNLMNHLFAPYIGIWMDVYLDDIMIYSDTLEEHIEHIRTVFKILKREKLFLNPKKMQFLAEELVVLGHRITDKGIKMDPHKVDSVAKWPTPTNKGLLASFIGRSGT